MSLKVLQSKESLSYQFRISPMTSSFDPRRIELLDPEVVVMLKAKSPIERLGMAMELYRLARSVLFARIQSQHPDWTAQAIDCAVSQRMSGGNSESISHEVGLRS